MVLSDKEIRKYTLNYKENGLEKPLIEKFSEERLQSESYDVTVSDRLMVFKKEVRCISLEDQEAVDRMYEQIPMKNDGYIISPKEYILITLNETISLPEFLTAHIRPRTRFTRLGLLVSDQHCNSTYSGILTLGLYNATEYPIKIRTGMSVAQVVFEELKSVPSENKQYKNKSDAAYQNEKGNVGAKFDSEFEAKVDKIVEQMLNREK